MSNGEDYAQRRIVAQAAIIYAATSYPDVEKPSEIQ